MAQATSRHGNAAVGVGRVAKGVGSECVCYRSNGTAVKILMISLHAPPENRHALYRATGIFTALHQSLKTMSRWKSTSAPPDRGAHPNALDQ